MTENVIDALTSIGFTHYEAKVYHALLSIIEPASGYEVAKVAGIPTSKVYETLRKLQERGAILIYESDTTTYAAIPHSDLIPKLKRDAEARYERALDSLATLPAKGQPGLTWTVRGTENVVEQFRRAIHRAEQSVLAALWDSELIALAPDLIETHGRGIDLHIALYGSATLPIKHTYDLALCGASAEERLSGRRLGVLVRDGREAVAAEAYPASDGTDDWVTEAIWSENRVFTLLCSEYAKEEIMGRVLIDALGVADYLNLRKNRPELRTMLRPEEAFMPRAASSKKKRMVGRRDEISQPAE